MDKVYVLALTGPEMIVLHVVLRTEYQYRANSARCLYPTPGTLTTNFFINLLDMNTTLRPIDASHTLFEGCNRTIVQQKWTGTRVDLIFGSHSQLRALVEVYASADAQTAFVHDFCDCLE